MANILSNFEGPYPIDPNGTYKNLVNNFGNIIDRQLQLDSKL